MSNSFLSGMVLAYFSVYAINLIREVWFAHKSKTTEEYKAGYKAGVASAKHWIEYANEEP